MQTVLTVLGCVVGLATVFCAVLAVYSLPMGIILKERKQVFLGLKCLAGAIAGAFISIVLIALIYGKNC